MTAAAVRTTVGIDLGGTNTKVVVLEEGCAPVARHDFPSDGDAGAERWGEVLVEHLEEVVGERPVHAVGLSVAGLVDDRRRIVEAPNLRAFEGVDVAAPLRGHWPQATVVVENDVNAALVGELRCGAGRGCRNLCMLSLGTGVGGAIVLEGELHRGAHGLGGELGHMILDHDGPICTCGRRGHVEAFLSTEAIVARAEAALARDPDAASPLARAVARGERPEPRVLASCARAGCALSREVLAASGRWLGIACTSLAHALQPERILIGGGVSRAAELLLEPARAEYEQRRMRAFAGSSPIVLAELGVDGAAVGAALIARESLDGASA